MKALAKVGLVGAGPTGAALCFLRPYRWFWRALSVAAMAMPRRLPLRSSSCSWGEAPARAPS